VSLSFPLPSTSRAWPRAVYLTGLKLPQAAAAAAIWAPVLAAEATTTTLLLRLSTQFCQNTELGLAITIDEQVPTIIPIATQKEKPPNA
jgi:hypothetical protein